MVLNKIARENEISTAENKTVNDDFSIGALERSYEVDVLSQFKANVQQIEDLNARLRFTLSEVSSLLKRH